MPNDMPAAERILLGNVRMLDPEGRSAEAIAVRDGKVLHVGSRDEVLATRGETTAVHDFSDATIIPGFNDTHAHVDNLGMTTIRPSLAGLRSVEAILGRIGELARQARPGEWIVTMPVGDPPYYWNVPGGLAEGRMPTRQELDAAAPDNPVFISPPSGYWGLPPCYMAMNSLALKLNGIDRDTRPRAGGIEIFHDAAGDPTGVVVEHNHLQLADLDLLPAVPRFSFEERVEGLRRALPLYAAKGTTSIYEGHGCAPAVLASFHELWQRGELTLRSGLVVSPAWSSAAEADRMMHDWLPYARGKGLGDAMLRITGIFVAYGGDPAVTRLAHGRSEDIAWGGGIRQANSPSEFEEICMLAGRHDIRVHTLASDKLHEVVPVFERVAEHFPIGQRRWVIEHVSRARADDLRTLKRLGVGVTLIPAHFLWKWGYKFADLPDEELDLLSPARALAELDVPVSAATDAVPNDPLFCLWAMTVRRERLSGKVLGPAGRMSNEQALRLLTVNGSWLTFEESVKGPLLPGYYADLAVLSGDPVATTGDDILTLKCRATMVGGNWVYGDEYVS